MIKQEGHKIQTIAEVFSILETNKDILNIESYLLSETTLEQIFMSFAKYSNPYNLSTLRPNNNENRFTTFGFDTKLNEFDDVPKVLSSFHGSEPVYYQPSEASSKSFIQKLRKAFKNTDHYEVKF